MKVRLLEPIKNTKKGGIKLQLHMIIMGDESTTIRTNYEINTNNFNLEPTPWNVFMLTQEAPHEPYWAVAVQLH